MKICFCGIIVLIIVFILLNSYNIETQSPSLEVYKISVTFKNHFTISFHILEIDKQEIMLIGFKSSRICTSILVYIQSPIDVRVIMKLLQAGISENYLKVMHKIKYVPRHCNGQ